MSSHGEGGQQVTGLPVGTGCAEALLLPSVVSAASSWGLADSSEVETSVVLSLRYQAPLPIFLFFIIWMKHAFGHIATT